MKLEKCEKRRVVYDTLEEEAEQFDIEVEAVFLSRRITVRRPTTYIGDIVKEFCSQVILSVKSSLAQLCQALVLVL